MQNTVHGNRHSEEQSATQAGNSYWSDFTYDAGNRVTQHKLKKLTGPPPPVTIEQYDYNYSPGGLPSDTFGYTRAETATGDTYLIAFDRLNRINREKMTNGGTTKFQFDHTYDSAGNRTALTIAGTLYSARSFGYTYNGMGHLTQIAENVNLNNYTATPTTDANGNITQIDEKWNGANTLTNTFVYDRENRLVEHDIAAVGVTVEHAYDGLGRLVKTMRTKSGTTTDYEHVRDGLKLVGNIDATHSNTAPSWTNHPHALRPLASQQVQTNSATQFINVADEISSSRRTYNPSNSAAGDTEAIAAKGRLVLINGAVPTVQTQTGVYPSELFSHRNPTYNENTIAVSSDRGALEISGANLMYEGTRVKTWIVGRDLNPGGRGDGAHYAQGKFSAGKLRPSPTATPIGGKGNSVNNGEQDTPSFDVPPDPLWNIGYPWNKNWQWPYCPPMVAITDNVSWGSSSNCQTPMCLGELCNMGCGSGWVSGGVVVCCKNPNKPCFGPISVQMPGLSNTSTVASVNAVASIFSGPGSPLGPTPMASDSGTVPNLPQPNPALPYIPPQCANAGYCFGCCPLPCHRDSGPIAPNLPFALGLSGNAVRGGAASGTNGLSRGSKSGCCSNARGQSGIALYGPVREKDIPDELIRQLWNRASITYLDKHTAGSPWFKKLYDVLVCLMCLRDMGATIPDLNSLEARSECIRCIKWGGEDGQGFEDGLGEILSVEDCMDADIEDVILYVTQCTDYPQNWKAFRDFAENDLQLILDVCKGLTTAGGWV